MFLENSPPVTKGDIPLSLFKKRGRIRLRDVQRSTFNVQGWFLLTPLPCGHLPLTGEKFGEGVRG
jgi:hypothetical protein